MNGQDPEDGRAPSQHARTRARLRNLSQRIAVSGMTVVCGDRQVDVEAGTELPIASTPATGMRETAAPYRAFPSGGELSAEEVSRLEARLGLDTGALIRALEDLAQNARGP